MKHSTFNPFGSPGASRKTKIVVRGRGHREFLEISIGAPCGSFAGREKFKLKGRGEISWFTA